MSNTYISAVVNCGTAETSASVEKTVGKPAPGVYDAHRTFLPMQSRMYNLEDAAEYATPQKSESPTVFSSAETYALLLTAIRLTTPVFGPDRPTPMMLAWLITA